MNVSWSDRLERLAEALFDRWDQSCEEPFARVCVVVGDLATQKWLQQYFLFHRRNGKRKILANIVFRPLPEFVNDWLAAQTAKKGPRRPTDHPYAKGILAWRIEAILRQQAEDPAFDVLTAYIKGKDGDSPRAACRRFELATRLAALYDDYLGGRFKMLTNWERGLLPEGADRWQAALYRKLVAEAPETYTRDYEAALAPEADLSTAFTNGFPRYAAVHVFDVAAAPWPYLLMLERISRVLPVMFWTFNPSRDYWLEDATKKQAMREFAKRLRTALERGEPPPAAGEEMFGTPDLRLLGALASGARGVLSAELDLDENGCDWLGEGTAEDFEVLRQTHPEIHVCHSARRELEVAREALHRFFSAHPEARPCEALVLCADWATSAPLVESVFGRSGNGTFPVVLDGGLQEETPITHSFEALLAFRSNRFEVNAVFSLLGVPEIRTRFAIDADGLSLLRDMVKGANIHWGYDDADVKAALGETHGEEAFPFTWRRGLDRLTADALLGPHDDARELFDLGEVGRLMPSGNVEDERFRLVGQLNAFVAALNALRRFLQRKHTMNAWRERLIQAVDDFYSAEGDAANELSALRKAVDVVAHDVLMARAIAQEEDTAEALSGEVVCRSTLAALASTVRRGGAGGDAVRFAPLNNGTAVPAKFVWICGLNDGTFPRCEFRPSFDLIGRHPSWFDVSTRERDAAAFLKAALGARVQLAFSYVGRSSTTNDEVPAAVPLIDMMEWFKARGVAYTLYQHPLQSYSARYFTPPDRPELALPPSFSAVDHDAAVAIASLRDQTGTAAQPAMVKPFALAETGTTEIDIDELARFYARPQHFLAKVRLGVRTARAKYDQLDDADEIARTLPGRLANEILLNGELGENQLQEEAARLREEGFSLTVEELTDMMKARAEATQPYRERPLEFKKTEREGFANPDQMLAAACAVFDREGLPVAYGGQVEVDGRPVAFKGGRREIGLEVVPSRRLAHTFAFSSFTEIYPSLFVSAWIRHVAGHAAGGEFVTVLMCAKDAPARTFRPMGVDEAKAILANVIHQALQPMAFDILAANGVGGDLPEALAEAVGGYRNAIVSTVKPRGKR